MKFFITSLLNTVISVAFLYGSTAMVFHQSAMAANIAQSICQYVAADDKKRMRSFLKTNKLKIRNIFKGIQCNGQNLLVFAASRGSLKTGQLMISKLPKKVIKAELDNLAGNAELLAAANKRIN